MSRMFRLAAVCLFCVFPPMVRAEVTVVEYHHAGFDHYFLTPVAAEIALLDARAPPFELWSRTGFSFRAYEGSAAPAGSVPICRFFNASFAPKSSHFYAPRGLGCEETIARFPDWGLEDDQLFASMLPDAGGACPADTVPIYRLYNNGQGGAPNHRFVGSLAERQTMLDRGFLAEGSGIGVGMCVPPDPVAGSANGLWRGTTDRGQDVRIFILDDGTFYLVYSEPGGRPDAGVVYGSARTQDGTFTSLAVRNYSLTGETALFIGGTAPIGGPYLPGKTLRLSNGSSTVTAIRDDAFDQRATLASLAGPWTISVGHVTETTTAIGQLDDSGHIKVPGRECDFEATLTATGTTNVFDMTVVNTRGQCYAGGGVFLYDAARRQFLGLAPFQNSLLGIADLFHLVGTR